MNESKDPILKSILKELIEKHSCHTVLLYGSRARGLETPTSDYDVIGIRKQGKKFRIAKKQKGFYWDVFVYPEKDLRILGQENLNLKDARILFQKGTYGTYFLKRLTKLLNKPFKPHSQDEVDALKVWAQKQIERCRTKDIQGLFRRAEFLNSLVYHYFYMRQKRFEGPKEAFALLEKNDPKTFKLVKRALKNPTNLYFLKAAAQTVYRVSLI